MYRIKTWSWRRHFLPCLVSSVLILSLTLVTPASLAADARTVVRACSISSDHPYRNNENLVWPVGEAGAAALRLNFSRLEVEDGYDFVILNSTYGEIKITGSYPGGLWSEWVTGTSWTLRLVSNSYNTAYGFDCVAYEIEVSPAWDMFWYTAFPAIVAIAVFLVIFEVHARNKPAAPPREGAQAPRHPY